jgi:RNA polymerase-binding transcription factor DksA
MLKHKLLAQRSALLRSAHDDLARWAEHPIGEIAGEVPDVGDESVAALVTDADHSMLQRHVAVIRDIDTALSRIGDRTYAVCTDCGDDIGLDRLSEFPTAERCIGCQPRHEATFATGAGATL